MRQEILTGLERRRRWSDGEKRRILAEVGVDGASVASIARRHDITRQHLYQWRSQFRRAQNGRPDLPMLLPVELADEAECRIASTTDEMRSADFRIEVAFGNGRVLRSAPDLPEALLARLIRTIEAA